jgi:uncharacterized membrane protein
VTSIQVSIRAPKLVERPMVAPCVPDVVTRVVVSLLTAVVAPSALFAATLVIFNLTAAVLIALAWVVGAMCWRWTSNRPVSGLLVLTLGIMTAKTGITLATGNTFIYFVQPVFVDLVVSAVFLGSLCSARPMVARLAPDFFPMSTAVTARPAVCRLFRRLTLMWGLVILAKGTLTLWLLTSLSTVSFVLIKGGAIITLTLTAAVVTVVWSVIVGRHEGLLRATAPAQLRANSSAPRQGRDGETATTPVANRPNRPEPVGRSQPVRSGRLEPPTHIPGLSRKPLRPTYRS